MAAITASAAIVYYWVGGTDTDIGALLGSRADERQATVRLRARAFAAVALLAACAVGAVVAAALHRPAWPYSLVAGLGVAAFLVGLAVYRAGARVRDAGPGLGAGARLDERRAAIALHALQLAGIAMFLAAVAGGLALTGRAGADPLRILASAFAVALLVGLAIFRPGRAGG